MLRAGSTPAMERGVCGGGNTSATSPAPAQAQPRMGKGRSTATLDGDGPKHVLSSATGRSTVVGIFDGGGVHEDHSQ